MNIELGEVQAAFADIIWTNEPVGSGELVKICERELKWKKPTTYTVLRKLCEKGLFKNEDGVVTSVISREEFNASKSEKFIEETFDGSLPAFIAAFIVRRHIVGGTYRTLISVKSSLRLCRTGICRRFSAG